MASVCLGMEVGDSFSLNVMKIQNFVLENHSNLKLSTES